MSTNKTTLEPLINLFSFRGRIARDEYVKVLIFCSILNVFVLNLFQGLFIDFILYVVTNYILVTQTIKRAHDIGYGGWFVILFLPYIFTRSPELFKDVRFIPFSYSVDVGSYMIQQGLLSLITAVVSLSALISFFLIILLMFKRGDVGETNYGTDPLENKEKTYVAF